MDINYDPEIDVLSILFSSQAIEESDEAHAVIRETDDQ